METHTSYPLYDIERVAGKLTAALNSVKEESGGADNNVYRAGIPVSVVTSNQERTTSAMHVYQQHQQQQHQQQQQQQHQYQQQQQQPLASQLSKYIALLLSSSILSNLPLQCRSFSVIPLDMHA